MNVPKSRIAEAERRRALMLEGIADMDVAKIRKAMLDGVTLQSFAVGRRYRLAVLGGAVIPDEGGLEAARDTKRPLVDRVEAMIGMKARDQVGQARVAEVTAVYAGRANAFGRPHVFRLPNGLDAVLGDMDVLAWERV